MTCALGWLRPAAKKVGIPGCQNPGRFWPDSCRDSLANVPAADFPVPAGVTFATVDASNGYLAAPWCPKTITAAYRAGTEPKEYCPLHGGEPAGLPSMVPPDRFASLNTDTAKTETFMSP
jgi:membrane carboxypeptidase/penicillin-binding protein